MASFVSAANTTFNALSGTVAFSPANTAGNLLVCASDVWFTGSTTQAIGDTQGNVWVQIFTGVQPALGEDRISWWYCIGCKGGANTVTITTGNAGAFVGVWVMEFTAKPYATEAGGMVLAWEGVTAVTAHSSGVTAALPAVDLVIGSAHDNGAGVTYSTSDGKSLPAASANTPNAGTMNCAGSYLLSAATGTKSAGWTSSGAEGSTQRCGFGCLVFRMGPSGFGVELNQAVRRASTW